VFRRSLSVIGLLALAGVVAGSAQALDVRVRVEGRTTTIFGAAEPSLIVRATALDALEAASLSGEFYYHVSTTAFGPYVDQIGRYPAAGSAGWVFKVNGASPPVGADQVRLKNGDRVLWYAATFGPAGGPPTLLLQRQQRRGCYRVLAQDDAGKTRPAVGATLFVDLRRVPTKGGRACVGRHRSFVRALKPGAVRSNALP
jgi:Domain of unknown function (DUF4430)